MIDSDFSLVIPAKGNCIYLNETLISVTKSSLMPKIIYLVDDGITSDVKKLCQKYMETLPIVMIENNGHGLVDALNTGIENVKTEYIARLDSDDLVFPERFKTQINYLKENNNVVLLGGQIEYIDSDGLILGESSYPSGRIDLLKNFAKSCLLAHPSVMMRTKELKLSGGYLKFFRNGSSDIAEDFDLWLRLKELGEVHNLPIKIISYRQHSEQLSVKNTDSQVLATLLISKLFNLDKNHRQLKGKPIQLEKINDLVSFLIKNRLYIQIGYLMKIFLYLIIMFNYKNLFLNTKLKNYLIRRINL